jgi:thioredoxin
LLALFFVANVTLVALENGCFASPSRAVHTATFYFMKQIQHLFALVMLTLFATAFSACGQKQQSSEGTQGYTQVLDAVSFGKAFEADAQGVLIDVRTKEEFDSGHLDNALLMDWRSNDFDTRAAAVDKAKTIYIYCLSGGRSADAADHLRGQGYKVVEMDGGIMKWKSAGLAVSNATAPKADEISAEQYTNLTNTGTMVLVDMYAPWCAPCLKMAPSLDQIKEEMKGRVEVVRIDVDKNKALAANLKVDALPTLLFYNQGKLVWNHTGFLTKDELVKKINGE